MTWKTAKRTRGGKPRKPQAFISGSKKKLPKINIPKNRPPTSNDYETVAYFVNENSTADVLFDARERNAVRASWRRICRHFVLFDPIKPTVGDYHKIDDLIDYAVPECLSKTDEEIKKVRRAWGRIYGGRPKLH